MIMKIFKLCGIAVITSVVLLLYSCSDKQRNLVETIELNKSWEFTDSESENWLSAKVPGCVHSDLLRHKKIEDPFYRLNEHNVQWVDKKDWIYKTSFNVSDKKFNKNRIQLVFKGLDTHADVFLNGKEILKADNMFREWIVEVKDYVVKGENELKIYFHSPIKVGLDKYDNYPHIVHSSANDLAEIGKVPGNKWVSPHLRKPGYHFGWDWGPRLVTSGIWETVYLKSFDSAQINDVRIVQSEVKKEKASLIAEYEVESNRKGEAILKIWIDNILESEKKVKLIKGINQLNVDFKIDNPKLWWTNGLGSQYLYNIRAELNVDGNIDSKSINTGIRTVELVREKDSIGTSFYFKLNGHPVFMKGANYIPNDVFLDRVTPEKYEEVILRAKECNYNMLRIWGGGIYEKDIFYDLCDKHGILVWQDFMFACNMYPGHPEYLESVRQEAIYNIKRLRNHACIAMWCGNNEVLAAWKGWGWDRKTKKEDPAGNKAQWKAYKDIFLDVLPNAVKKYDPQRFYWASSPQAGDTIKANLTDGDDHYWAVWGGAGAEFFTYKTNIARFMSEYGFQAFPDISTVKKYTVKEDWDIYSEVMKSHQRSYVGNKQIAKYMDRDYRKPKDFESFLYVGQVLQAEGIRMAMESHRVAMPKNMGSLFWQHNDCWPVASWSSTDYYGKWKALQYFTKKAFQDIIVVSEEVEGIINTSVVSDRHKAVKAKLLNKVVDFQGKVLWEDSNNIIIKPNTSLGYFSFEREKMVSNKNLTNSLLVSEVYIDDKLYTSNTYYFKPVKDLELPQNKVMYTISRDGEYVEYLFSTEELAKNLYISIEGYDGNFSDNFFDLLPGEKKIVRIKSDKSVSELNENTKFLTIRNTY